ncbi:hypothetical protein Pelo_19334 [Pelomyxa schiedti]|nr:hypothetical protein Pelo_19334 [Pelomyxa schiedti]
MHNDDPEQGSSTPQQRKKKKSVAARQQQQQQQGRPCAKRPRVVAQQNQVGPHVGVGPCFSHNHEYGVARQAVLGAFANLDAMAFEAEKSTTAVTAEIEQSLAEIKEHLDRKIEAKMESLKSKALQNLMV